MPFKLDDGSDYFEKVEFLRDLTKLHYQNYLAFARTTRPCSSMPTARANR